VASALKFVLLKSYDGGKHWEPAGRYDDFVSATKAAMFMRRQTPSLRVRQDVEMVRQSAPKAARRKRRQR
jgi:hypothetical protein